jgi:hypothetical protein
MSWQGGVAVAIVLLGLWAGGARSATAVLLDQVRVTACQYNAAICVALCLQEDASGGGGCVAAGREAGAGGRVVEGTAPQWDRRWLPSIKLAQIWYEGDCLESRMVAKR